MCSGIRSNSTDTARSVRPSRQAGSRDPDERGLKHPPAHFRGSFSTDAAATDPYCRAAGPVSMRPAAVAAPRGAEDVSTLSAWATEEGFSLTPRGAGTGMPGGNVGTGILVDLSTHFGDVGTVDPAERTCWTDVGAIAATVDQHCAEAGLSFPPLPASADRCSIGGMIANNAAGPRSFRHGATRDWIEALEVVLPDGHATVLGRASVHAAPFQKLHQELTRTNLPLSEWPSTRKNSSGYALDSFIPTADPVSLLVGSEGTLGSVTRAKLRLIPRPACRAVMALRVDDLDELPLIVEAVTASGASACEFLARRFLEIARLDQVSHLGPIAGGEALILLEMEGTRSEVDDSLGHMDAFARGAGFQLTSAIDPAEADELWSIRRAASPIIAAAADDGLRSIQFIEDSVVPVSSLATYLRRLESILADEATDAVMFGHAGDGNVHVNPLIDVRRKDWRARVRRILDRTADLVADLGGTLSGEHGDGRVRAPYLERIWGTTFTEAFHTVKRQFDPAGIMNPGVVIPAPGQDPLDGMEDWT